MKRLYPSNLVNARLVVIDGDDQATVHYSDGAILLAHVSNPKRLVAYCQAHEVSYVEVTEEYSGPSVIYHVRGQGFQAYYEALLRQYPYAGYGTCVRWQAQSGVVAGAIRRSRSCD